MSLQDILSTRSRVRGSDHQSLLTLRFWQFNRTHPVQITLFHHGSSEMNQKGLINIITIIELSIFAGGAGYSIVNQRTLSLSPTPSLAPTPTATRIPSPSRSPALTNQKSVQQITPSVISSVLSVVELLTNREQYLGTQVSVRGRIVVNIIYSERPCQTDGSVCDTTMGAQLELWEPQQTPGTEKKILIFRHGQPYACQKIAPEQYRCGTYINGELLTVHGIWSKDQVPDQVVGYSGGQPPRVLKWRDRYFLEIK